MWITTPLQIWLASFLQPMINETLHTVARDTSSIIDTLQKVKWSTRGVEINTFDVERLYPSMDFEKIRQVTQRFLLRYFNRFPRGHYGVIIEVVHEILSIIFDAQVCKYRRREGAIDTMLFSCKLLVLPPA